jgi:hypothetical protein
MGKSSRAGVVAALKCKLRIKKTLETNVMLVHEHIAIGTTGKSRQPYSVTLLLPTVLELF